jgi:hypothetical protein
MVNGLSLKLYMFTWTNNSSPSMYPDGYLEPTTINPATGLYLKSLEFGPSLHTLYCCMLLGYIFIFPPTYI